MKEEQLSEAWSLDADPPESVNNEPINDPLGLLIDENSSNSNLGGGVGVTGIALRTQSSVNSAIMRTPSIASNTPVTPASSVASSVISSAANAVPTGNLINFSDQVRHAAFWLSIKPR